MLPRRGEHFGPKKERNSPDSLLSSYLGEKEAEVTRALRTVPTFDTVHTLRASRVFLWVVPTNTGIFLRGLKLYRENRT